MKLPISLCFFALSQYEAANKMAADYTATYSSDWRGWRMLGSAKLALRQFDDAISAYEKAIALGDEGVYIGLGAASLESGRMELFDRKVMPRLLTLKDSDRYSENERLEMRGLMITYALRIDDRAKAETIYCNALDGVTTNDLAVRPDLKAAVQEGCKKFSESAKAAAFCLKLGVSSN